MKLKELIVTDSVKYYYNTDYITCVIKGCIKIDSIGWQAVSYLNKRCDSLLWTVKGIEFSVKGVAKCAEGDAFSYKEGEAIARSKAKMKFYKKGYSIWHKIAEFYEEELQKAYATAQEFDDLLRKEERLSR